MEVLEPHRPEVLPDKVWDLQKFEWDGGSLLLSLQSIPSYEQPIRAFVYFSGVQYVRSLDEGGRLAQLAEWSERGLVSCPVCVVKNSRLLQEVTRMSYGATNVSAATHYIVLSADECVDVLSHAPPDIWLSSEAG